MSASVLNWGAQNWAQFCADTASAVLSRGERSASSSRWPCPSQHIPGRCWLVVSPVSSSAGVHACAAAWACSCLGVGLGFGVSWIPGFLLAPLRSPCGAAQLQLCVTAASTAWLERSSVRVQLLNGALPPSSPTLHGRVPYTLALSNPNDPSSILMTVPCIFSRDSCWQLLQHSCFAL